MTDILDGTPWQNAKHTPLAGDASARRYTRLNGTAGPAILMDDPDGGTALFARLSRHLRNLGLSAPDIYRETPGQLLLEDLGDGLFARLCAADPTLERPLYLAATDALIALHRHKPLADLPVASPEQLAQMTDLAFDWYTQNAADDKTACAAKLETILAQNAPENDVIILRDFHAENLVWLPDRAGAARAGLLDFQDAMQGHRAYDLVSLVRDARRDVSNATANAIVAHYIKATGQDADTFSAAFAALGVQRNLRILGIFARLAAMRGKPQYIDLIPRVWAHLQTDLAHPALAGLRNVLTRLPEPTARHLERLKTSCPTP